ncbi:hypothetical protein HBI81_034860 [Parastagonospora nodorum]|nr:hypothetical protein HBH52_077650 [Parastagonospora nodorum]KAH4041008.1 hypothetical protein HBI09_016840 [Parastagonospora nodorum]KAH4058439.1 hypothetical protein HBH49_033090 [Parastagonospora nodorum]KAH4237904.1 hypothetical protein HBI05_127260 [Parastagonospora nodorum]KAH4238559.1 hypothetical protein HBI06_040710 [Parastagonospora nodorum]
MIMPTFSELPTETKLNVFAFLRNNTDRARSCLVSRDWLTCMAPLLWKILEIKPDTVTAENLASILNPKSNIIKNIRYINIKHQPHDCQDRYSPELEAVVQIIITALPRNSLRGIMSLLPISLSVMIQLLQCQQTMRTLYASVDSTTYNFPVKYDSVAYTTWVEPALTKLEELIVYIRDDVPDSYKAGAALINSSNEIRSLSIWASGDRARMESETERLNIFQGVNTITLDFEPLQLLHLQLCSLNLVAPPTLAKYVNLQTLRDLRLFRCGNIVPVITSLASSLSESAALDTLEIVVFDEEDKITQAIEKLLGSFSELKGLWLDMEDARMIDVSCLSRHGSLLRQLGLSSYPKARQSLSVETIQAVITSCPFLEGLAVDFPVVDMGHIQTLGSNFEILTINNVQRASTEFEAFLEIITGHRSLRLLRMFTLPVIDYGKPENPTVANTVGITDEEVYATQAIMHKLATSVMRQLRCRGSNVSRISIQPGYNCWETRPECDENRHVWPEYYYLRGHTLDVTGAGSVTAVPVSWHIGTILGSLVEST